MKLGRIMFYGVLIGVGYTVYRNWRKGNVATHGSVIQEPGLSQVSPALGVPSINVRPAPGALFKAKEKFGLFKKPLAV